MVLTSTGTFLIPRECALVFHSINLAFVFDWRSFAAFTVSWFRGMENEMGSLLRRYNGMRLTPIDVLGALRGRKPVFVWKFLTDGDEQRLMQRKALSAT